MTAHSFAQRLREPRPLLLDAAMGTALCERGLEPAREDAISWSRTHAGEIRRVHRAHRAAGAELLLANTFGARAPSPEELATALSLARESGAPFVALPLWPGLPPEELARAARGAADAGADALWLETAMRAEDAERSLQLVREASTLPVAVTLALAAFPSRAGGRGELRALFARLAEQGAAIVGLNCGPWETAALDSPASASTAPAHALAELVLALVPTLPIPFALKPDAGHGSPERWAALVADAVRSGARLAGGCCGTDARHLRALRETGCFAT